MSRVGAREYSNWYLLYFGFLLKSHTFSHTIPPPLTTQCARASAILTQISGNGQHFRATCCATNVVLQIEIVCCAYYHLGVQEIFMLQKVDVAFTFCRMKICCALNLQLARQFARRCFSYYLAFSIPTNNLK